MAKVGLLPGHEQLLEGADPGGGPPAALADEHLPLLLQAAARAEQLLTTAAAGRWPGIELMALANYVQAEVPRQVSDEESLLFPTVPAQAAT